MTAIRKVLVAVAFPSDRRQPGLQKAAQLAGLLDAELELFHSLYNPQVHRQRVFGTGSLQTDIETLVQQTRQRLDRLAAPLIRDGLRVSTSVHWDYPPYEGIVRQVLRHKAGLVVADTQRHGGASRLLLTHTDWQLIRLCPCPLLLVKNDRPYRQPRILAAVDPAHAGAKPADLDSAILDYAALLCDGLRGELHAFHACTPLMTFAPGALVGPLPALAPAAESRSYERRVRREVKALVSGRGIGARRLHVAVGEAAVLLPAQARRLRAQLVVMGAVSRSWLKRLLIGNTAERVLDALSCDVLIVKPPNFRTPVPGKPDYRPVLRLHR